MGIPPIDDEIAMQLPMLRLTKPRPVPQPEANYIEVMGIVYLLRDNGFVILSWDYVTGKLCYIPFADKYPYPDEYEEFAWIKGKFDPATSSIHFIDSQSISFFEPEEAKNVLREIKAIKKERWRKHAEKKRLEQEPKVAKKAKADKSNS